jgi:hypothetical protein
MVYVGGAFTQLTDSSGSHLRSYLARVGSADGVLDSSWTAQPDDKVWSLAVSGDGQRLYIGGDFASVSGHGAVHLARLGIDAGNVGNLAPGFVPGPTNGSTRPPVLGLFVDGSTLLVAAGGSGGGCAALDASTGATRWNVHTNGNVQQVVAAAGTVYCGGHFEGTGSFAGLTRHRLAAVDETTGAVLGLAPRINSALGVWCLAGDSNQLSVGGDFSVITGQPQPHFAEFLNDGAQTVPAAPPQLVARPGDSSARLFWDVPWTDGGSSVQYYRIYRGVAGGSFKRLAKKKLTSWVDSSATNGTSYQYAISAVNGMSEGVLSTPQTVVPSPGAFLPPMSPLGLTAVGAGGTVQLSWRPPYDDGQSPLTSYVVMRGDQQGTEQEIAGVSGATTSYQDTPTAPADRQSDWLSARRRWPNRFGRVESRSWQRAGWSTSWRKAS